ncbi:hypothetical protein D9M72_533350 [compost metagenome]
MRRLRNSPCQVVCAASAAWASGRRSAKLASAGSSARRRPRTSSAPYWVMLVKAGLTYSSRPSRSSSRKALELCSTARWNRCRVLETLRRSWFISTWAYWSASSPAKAISSLCHWRGAPTCSRQSTPTTSPPTRMLASSREPTPSGRRNWLASSRVRGSCMTLWASMARPLLSASR